MAIAINNYLEFETLVQKLWNRTPLFGFVLYDSRISHRAVVDFLDQSAGWLDELALQCGVYILFPLRTGESEYRNPSPQIVLKKFPELFVISFADGLGKAMGSSVLR